MRLSVCTPANERGDHLVNLVLALRRSLRPPVELVIAGAPGRRYDLPLASFPVRLEMLGETGLPRAVACNAAAARTSGDLLVFLDADCLPHPRLLDAYAAAGSRGGLLMGEVVYLPKGACEAGIDYDRFEADAVANPDRPVAPAGDAVTPCRDFRCFRGDNFAIPRHDFAAAGGFDERYMGHGGEDIDFARAAMSSGLPLAWVAGAKAYHQQHAELVPPVDRLDEVLANAALFESKWRQGVNRGVMQDWLDALVQMGLVEHTEEGWRKLRDPAPRDLALAGLQADQPYASVARVLERLEQRTTAGRPSPLRPAA